jgi:predicted Co/Zn/Cd cation transporter (cation efflux family)
MRTIKGFIAIDVCFVAFGIITMVLFEATFIYYEGVYSYNLPDYGLPC